MVAIVLKQYFSWVLNRACKSKLKKNCLDLVNITTSGYAMRSFYLFKDSQTWLTSLNAIQYNDEQSQNI